MAKIDESFGEKIVRWSARLLEFLAGFCIFAVILICTAHLLDIYAHNLLKVPLIGRFVKLEYAAERPFFVLFNSFVPAKVNGRDLTAGLAGFTLLVLSIILGRVAIELKTLHEKWGAARKAELASHLDDLDRSKLLEVYSRAKKTLETLQRPIAFLSMDIVDSTGLKHGEDPSVAERDFRQYKHMVEAVFAANAAIKSTWTPDGVMAAFNDAPAAVQAGAATIVELQNFNAKVKTLRREFKLRVGVNAGTVLFDEKTPLEEMSDRVIDVAGHMQKHGSINMVCVPAEVASACSGKFDFKPAGRRIDGYDVSEWDPLAAPASA